MRITVGILGTLLAAVASWVLFRYLLVARGLIGAMFIRTPVGELHIIRGSV